MTIINKKLIAATTVLLLQLLRSSTCNGWLLPVQTRRVLLSSSRSRSSSFSSSTTIYQNAASKQSQSPTKKEQRKHQEVIQCPFPPNPLLHAETILPFDVSNYPLRERVLAVLGIDPSLDLSQLHEHSGRFLDKSGNTVNEVQAAWNANRNRDCDEQPSSRHESVRQFIPSDSALQYERFDEVYQAFIRDIVAPAMGGGRILYQRAPTLRVMSPIINDSTLSSSQSSSAAAPSPSSVMSKLHNDYNYHHQPSEINFWLPLTHEVFDSNSLWVESAPGMSDFHPLELKYGQITRFYGNQCRHYAKDNMTGMSRVSIDFRAVSDESGGHNPLFRKGVRRGAKARYQDVFDVPDFYSEVTIPKCDI